MGPHRAATDEATAEILDYLQEFIQQHGYAPSLGKSDGGSAFRRWPRSTNI
jgi:hypothetical protein